jgi:hypothetical protein
MVSTPRRATLNTPFIPPEVKLIDQPGLTLAK